METSMTRMVICVMKQVMRIYDHGAAIPDTDAEIAAMVAQAMSKYVSFIPEN